MPMILARFGSALVVVSILALLLPVGAVGRSEPASGVRAAEAVPLDPGTFVDRADLTPLPRFTRQPFASSPARIQTLAWADLPMNGLALLSLKIPTDADAEGIHYKIIKGRRTYSPGNLASDGLRYLDGYVRTGDPAYLDRAVVRARKLVERSVTSGGARFYYYDYRAAGLKAPWYSAYSQGFALSLFVRLYRVTGEPDWANHARETEMSFRRLGARGTVQPWVAYVRTGYLWLEQYPSSKPTHVLNAFNFAVFGLYDYDRLTRDPTARVLLRGALKTIRRYGATYRVPGEVSRYDLVHRLGLAHYHEVLIWQLRVLTAINGDPWYTELADLLRADYP